MPIENTAEDSQAAAPETDVSEAVPIEETQEAKEADLSQIQSELDDLEVSTPEPKEHAVNEADEPEETAKQDTEGEPEPAPAEEEEIEPEVATDDLEEEEEESEPEIQALDAPALWDENAKTLFAEASPALQTFLLEREKLQQAEIGRRQQEAAQLRKERVDEKQQLSSEIARSRLRFEGKWDGVNDASLLAAVQAQQITADDAARIQLEMNADKQAVEQLDAALSQIEAKDYQTFITEQADLLTTLAPELADPVNGPAIKGEMITYLRGLDYDDVSLKHISARDMSLAHKAMKYDALMAQKDKAKPPAKKTGKTLKTSGRKAKMSKSAKIRRARATAKTAQDLHDIDIMQIADELADIGG